MRKGLCYVLSAVLLLCCVLSVGCSRSKGEDGVELCFRYLDDIQNGAYEAAYALLLADSRLTTDTHDGYGITYQAFTDIHTAFIKKYCLSEMRYQVTSTACSKQHARICYDAAYLSTDGSMVTFSSFVDSHYDQETHRWGIEWRQNLDPNKEYAAERNEAGSAVCLSYLTAVQQEDYAAAYALLLPNTIPEGMTVAVFEEMFRSFYHALNATSRSFEVTDHASADDVVFSVYDVWYAHETGNAILLTGSILARYENGMWGVVWTSDLDPVALYEHAYGDTLHTEQEDAMAEDNSVSSRVLPDVFDIQTGDDLMALLLSKKKPDRADVKTVQLGDVLQMSVPTDWEACPDNLLDADLFFLYNGTDASGMSVSLCAYSYDFQQEFESLQTMASVLDPDNYKAALNGAEVLVVSNEYTVNLFFLTENGLLLAVVFGSENMDFHALSLSEKLIEDMTVIVHSIQYR